MSRIISAGAVIYRRERDGAIRFLILYHGKDYWNFPKGKLEQGERAMATFLREVEEETGLKRTDLRIVSGFQATDRYFLSPRRSQRRSREPRGEQLRPILKIVLYYLVETRRREVMISHEHEGFGWFTLGEALRITKFKNTQDILRRAHDFIQRNLQRYAVHPPRHGRHVR